MERSHQCGLNGVVPMKINGAVREILMKTCFVRNGFSLISENGFIDFQKDNGNKTALIRPFHRHLNLENRCRNKEMASYFEK